MKYVFVILIIMAVICNGCKENKKLKDVFYELIDCSKNNKYNLKTGLESYFIDDYIYFKYSFINNDSINYYIPVSDWIIQFKKDSTDFVISEPKNTYLINTIHIYPKIGGISGLMEMDRLSIEKYFPRLLKIKPGSSSVVNIYVFNYFDGQKSRYPDNKLTYLRLKKDIDYLFLSKIALLNEHDLQCLLSATKLTNYIDECLIVDTLVNMIPNDDNRLTHLSYMETKIGINTDNSILINEFFNEKKINLRGNVRKRL